jgi:CDP-6-deoxy-D-xylo-4-hexulose-3-dehydrase
MSYPLATSSWDAAEFAAMERVIRSGQFSMGSEVAAFEREFAQWLGSRYCVMVNSGSSANLLMIAALRYHPEHALKPGDEVIVPAVSWSTTYSPLYQYGLHLKFVDIDAGTLNMDLDAVAAAIGPKTRAILAVNLLGNPNDFARLNAIAKQHGVLLLEDNCESMGAEFAGRKAGSFGLAGTFSSFFSHHISTMEGGLIATDDETMYHVLLSLRAHGWTRNLPTINNVSGVKGDDPFEESFRFVLPGYNVRPLELSGAIGLEQLKKLPELVRARRENAEKFQTVMARYPMFQTQTECGASSWFGFSLVLRPDSGLSRKSVLAVFADAGIETRPIVTGNFTKNEVVRRWFDYTLHGELTNADWIDQNGFFIGNHHYSLDSAFVDLDRALRKATT